MIALCKVQKVGDPHACADRFFKIGNGLFCTLQLAEYFVPNNYLQVRRKKIADNLILYFDKLLIRVKYYHCCMCGIGTAPGGSFRSALVGSGIDATDDTSEMTLTSFSQ